METEIYPEMIPMWGNPDINMPFNVTLYNANIRYLKYLYIGNDRITQDELEFLIGKELTLYNIHSDLKKRTKKP